jgi:glycosyltransferase involved in cell wall biosynthesis
MRILHLDAGLELRGGQWQALRLAERLAKAGHQILFMAPQGSPCFVESRSLGLETKPLTAFGVRRFSGDFDICHAHDARSHTLAALFSVAPLVVSRRVSFPVRGGLSRWKYSRPRRFIAVSNYVKKVLLAAGVGSEKISVVYDGVPLLPPSIASQRIVAIDSADPAKGTALALEAARLANVNVHLSKNLEFDLRDAGLFLYISESEGLGSGALLAMAAGVPVVASNVGGLPEIVKDCQTGLLTGNTPEEIAAAILRVRDDYEFARLLGARGRQMVEDRFSIATMVASTTRVYQSC